MRLIVGRGLVRIMLDGMTSIGDILAGSGSGVTGTEERCGA
jgi:hypothetical protein